MVKHVATHLTCARCGAALPVDSPGGHCPHCLVAVALSPAESVRSGTFTPLLPRRFGDYELFEEIARGGMGIVYRARHLRLKRIVALKMILAGEFAGAQALRRFHQEAEAAARLQHANIVAIHDVGECEGQAYFTMDFVEGRTLAGIVRDQPLPARKVAEYVRAITEAVHFAHERGVLHRDLKPSNILIDSFDQPRITDFGLARTLDQTTDLTLTGQTLGSPGYTSPEQAFGQHDSVGLRSDVYSLGAILYHLLTGRAPFQGESVHDVLLQVKNAEPVPPRRLNPSVPVDLETICLKCLEKDSTRRYPSAAALADELKRFERDEPIQARPVSSAEKLWRWCRRRPAVAALGVSVFLLMMVVAIGSTIAAWRIDAARRAEQRRQREAEAANHDLRTTVGLLELERAEDLFRANDAVAGVAHLAAILRRDPSNHIAANRLVSALMHRNWALPALPPLWHEHSVAMVQFSPDGRRVLSVSQDSRRMSRNFVALSQSDITSVPDARDKAAHLWNAETGTLIAALPHDDFIYSGQYSTDGKRIVTASADGSARIWNATNGALLVSLRHEGKVYRAEFSRDNARVVTASADKTARIWDAASGELKQTLRGHNSAMRLAQFSPDGKRVASVTESGTIRLWELDSGELLSEFWGRHPVNALAFSFSGARIVAACANGTAWLLDPGTVPMTATPVRHGIFALPLWHAAFSRDDQFVLTTSEDTTARLWSATNGFPMGQPFKHEGGVVFGSFSLDGQLVATAASDFSARVWHWQTGKLFCQPLRHGGLVRSADFATNGHRLVTGSRDGTAQLWNIEPRLAAPIELSHANGVTTVDFHPRGDLLLTTSADKTARLWDARSGAPSGEAIKHSSTVLFGSFSIDGKAFATACSDGKAQVWDVTTRKVLAGPVQHTGAVRVARFSPDGKRFLTASADSTARVWDARTGEAMTPALVHRGEIFTADFSPDGRRVVTASRDKTARIWDAQTGQPTAQPLLHEDHVQWAEFSLDSERVVTASTDDTARVWDARTGGAITPPLRHGRIATMATFSPNGKRVATASLDWTARVWNAETGEALTPPLQHQTAVTHVRFSPDGRRIVTGGWNGLVRIWDAETGRPLTEWLGFAGRASSLCFDSTGHRVAVADGTLVGRVWDLHEAPMPVPQSFIALAEAVAGTRLSPRGNVELLPRGELEQRAREVSQMGAGNFYRRVSEWFLADPAQRPGSPF